MIHQMDAALLSLQAAAGARKLYGPEHAAARRQTALTVELLGAMFSSRRALRVVRLDGALLFDDAQLPSCVRFNDVLIPLLAAHDIEWIEFQAGLTKAELIDFLVQLEGPPQEGGRLGTPHVRVGQIGRGEVAGFDGATVGARAAAAGGAMAGTEGELPAGAAQVISIDRDQQVEQFRQIWLALRAGKRPDNRLAELVESIRLAVAVGADVCRQLADVKNHDEYTFVHTVNVAILSAALGEAVGMGANQVFDLTMASLLHDVGKQHTPLTILNKPGKLDESERKRMERHTVDGAAILMSRAGCPDFAPIVAFEHHANIDGTGYPNLSRNKRPHLASQIVHVADVFDALRTNRPYRAALDAEKVRSMLLEGAGKAFDEARVSLFLERVVKLSPGNVLTPKVA
jgi:putative nucleotidyltransferase with HDIG domain